MRKLAKAGGVVLALLVVAAGYYVWRLLPNIPERPFLKPAGPYPVGTREFDWVDSTRAEQYTKDPNDRRRVVVQVWYPAGAAGAVGAAGSGDTAKYLLRPNEFVSRLGAWAARRARTNSVLDAPVATADAPFPVILYNHGGMWTRWSATFTTEWLASQGYVVFSVEHFGFNQTAKYPDGTPFAADTLALPQETGDGKKDALSSWAFLDDPVFLIWKADAVFTLDQAERLNRESGPFQGTLDLERVGAYGWSFGGALAVQLTVDDPRVKAAVDHDGQLFGSVREVGTTRPVLQLHHGADDALDFPEKDRPAVREMMALVESWDSVARARSRADWFAVTIAGTDHGDFSDLALFYPRQEGDTDPRRAHEIINSYTLAFFDHYLRGRPAGLLEQPSSPFAEATVRRWPWVPADSSPMSGVAKVGSGR
jgi:predicted dienelactone hydrolase